jgi:hypothetical protein
MKLSSDVLVTVTEELLARKIPIIAVCKVKVKAKFSLCLIKHHAMKTYGLVEVQLHNS